MRQISLKNQAKCRQKSYQTYMHNIDSTTLRWYNNTRKVYFTRRSELSEHAFNFQGEIAMKKCLSVVLILAVIGCLLSVCVPLASAAENDSYYYYKVKVTTKIVGDIPSEDLYIRYSLHGINSLQQHFNLYDFDKEELLFKAGATEQTDVRTYYSEEPLIGVRFIQEGDTPIGVTSDENEYQLMFTTQTQQPGIENAVNLDQLQLIEGFMDGGIPILSELRDPVFTAKYNAPPVITGVEDGGEYYMTRKVQVKDSDLVSVTLNDKAVDIENGEALITLPGDVCKDYTIIAKDAESTCELTVTMNELNDLMEPVSGIDENNVKAEHKYYVIEALDYISVVVAQEPTPSDEEKARIDAMKKQLEGLLSRINEASKYINSENIENTKDITADNVKLTDKEALIKAESDLKKALEEYGGNYSDSDKKELQDDLSRISIALNAIKAMESPATGDNSHLALWLTLFVLSGVILVTSVRKIA